METMIEKIKENKIVVVLVAIILVLALSVVMPMLMPDKETTQDEFLETPVTQETTTTEVSGSETLTQEVTIDLKGAVVKEGVYQMPSGSRINDLIEKAGGFLETADKKSINLAEKLIDEQVVYVASQGENISVITPEKKENTEEKVNLNTASLEELQGLSGIGQKRAQDILDYRETNGSFSSLEELKNVSGIGEKMFDKLKEEVSLD
ncbi:helix-hairpin-helix domain-containing protein [Streptococcus pacificus]|uniref:Helix-hairpin-helix domain-containing protein n=1 Tax=Streptococcus pacificus TaxID=2740577 RepID=A0ABS0ZI46_9STRE|nr:helix-hairpin-helix domain-containing protein [Streptococcus pacificus]MBJ8325652.1 helix-hairpin-helix domain-containing protein [Streptococcus pacificus]